MFKVGKTSNSLNRKTNVFSKHDFWSLFESNTKLNYIATKTKQTISPTFCGSFSIRLLAPPNFPRTLNATCAIVSAVFRKVLHNA